MRSAPALTLRSQQDRVSRTLVRSPVRGEVKQLKVTTIGGVIQPGMDLIEIVPIEGNEQGEGGNKAAEHGVLLSSRGCALLTGERCPIAGGGSLRRSAQTRAEIA